MFALIGLFVAERDVQTNTNLYPPQESTKVVMKKLHCHRPLAGLALLVAGLLPLTSMATTSTYSASTQSSSSDRTAALAKQRKLREQFEKKREALEPKVSKSTVNSGRIQNFPIKTDDAPDQSATVSDSNN